MFLKSKFHHFHAQMLDCAYAGARGRVRGLYLRELSINRLNQTEPATFFGLSLAILLFSTDKEGT
jgi:hypothetical protein